MAVLVDTSIAVLDYWLILVQGIGFAWYTITVGIP